MTHPIGVPVFKLPTFLADDDPDMTARKLNQAMAALTDMMNHQRQPASVGWSITNVTQDRTLPNPASITNTQLGDILGTLITDLLATGKLHA